AQRSGPARGCLGARRLHHRRDPRLEPAGEPAVRARRRCRRCSGAGATKVAVMAFIEIRKLDKAFGSFRALKGVNLDVGEREVVQPLGPSACGKTTMLRTLAGFLTPDRGTIHVAGQQISSPAAVMSPERRCMGMVFQNYAVWPHMTVFENVAF